MVAKSQRLHAAGEGLLEHSLAVAMARPENSAQPAKSFQTHATLTIDKIRLDICRDMVDYSFASGGPRQDEAVKISSSVTDGMSC